MKKTVATIMIILFTAIGTGYAQIYKSQETKPGTTSGLKDSPASHSDDVSGNSEFFRAGDATGPGDRPGNGGGIGQEAPLKDGLHVILVCSLIFGIVKLSYGKKE